MDNASLVGWNLRTRKFGVIALCEPIVIYGPIFFFQGKHMPDQLVSVLGWLYLLGGLNVFVALVGTVFDKVKMWAWMALFLALLDLGLCVYPFAI